MTKKKYIIVLTFLVAAGVASYTISSSQTEGIYKAADFGEVGGEGPSKKVKESGLSDSSGEAMVYKVKKVKDVKAHAESLAKKLGLEGLTFDTTFPYPTGVLLKNGAYYMEVYDSGGFFFSDRSARNDEFDQLPTDEEARKIAEDFLKKVGKNYEFSSISYNYTGHGDGRPDDVDSKNVHFKVTLNGKQIHGEKVSITIVNKGQIQDAYVLTRDYVEHKKEKLDSPKKALKKVEKGEGLVLSGETQEEVMFTEAKVEYWAENTHAETEYVVPVYHYEGSTTEKGDAVDGFANALPDAVLKQ